MKRHRSTYDQEHREAEKERGPNGFRLCRWCRRETPSKRRTFCNDPQCLHEWKIRSDAQYLRIHVYRRDQGICALCGEFDERWQADHIIAVALGGGDCGLENIRTLCTRCHGQCSGALRKRLNAYRRDLVAAGYQVFTNPWPPYFWPPGYRPTYDP